MIRRFASLKSLHVPLAALGAWLGASLLAGCLGGDLDSSTVPPASVDTPPPHDSVVAAVHPIYPRLTIGEKWIYAQFSGTDTGTTFTAEVIGESTIGNDSVYVERITVTATPFAYDQSGTLVENYLQTGLLYVRKSDQETVHDSLAKDLDFVAAGDSVGVHYHEDYVSATRFTGSLPDSLKEGAAWNLAAVHFQTTRWSYPDTSGIDTGTDTRVRTYLVKPSVSLQVKAGTFPAFEIDEADTGSTSSTQVWFAPAAKAIIREIDTSPDNVDTLELTTLKLK